MDWENPRVFVQATKILQAWVTCGEDERYKHFTEGKKVIFFVTQLHYTMLHKHIQRMGTHLWKKRVRPVNSCCWRWYLVSTVTVPVTRCYQWFAAETHHYKQAQDRPNRSSLQRDEGSGIKIDDRITSVYNACYLSPRELIPSFSYICCQINKIFRKIYIKC